MKIPMTKLQYLDLKTLSPRVHSRKGGRASMACSLEVRAPFLDHELVEFVMGLPSRWKLKGFTSKYILKKAMGNWLPDEVINRPKKGFGVPIAKWVKGPLEGIIWGLTFTRSNKTRRIPQPPICDSSLSGSPGK